VRKDLNEGVDIFKTRRDFFLISTPFTLPCLPLVVNTGKEFYVKIEKV